MATGLLVVCVGRALKLVPYLQKGRKRYLAEVRFGLSTDTYDLDGKVLREESLPRGLHGKLDRALPGFLGAQRQKPPAYSAVKVDGQRLYHLARRGEKVEVREREVTFFHLEPISRRPDTLILDVVCTAGTYIRSLAHDLGQAVGCPAVLASLRRTESLPFRLEEARRFEDLVSGAEDMMDHLRPTEDFLPPLPRLTLSAEQEKGVGHGAPLTDVDCPVGPLLLLGPGGLLVAVGEGLEERKVRIRKVIRPTPGEPR